MKKFLKVAIIALILITAVIKQQSSAQIYGEYKIPRWVKGVTYVPLTAGNSTLLASSDFKKYPIPPGITDDSAGYARIPIGFPFEFNGDRFYNLYVCVNGFVQFRDPLFLPQENGTALFQDVPSTFPGDVIAPYWGNHTYRTVVDEQFPKLYKRSAIRYQLSGDTSKKTGVLTIEWNDLNINDPSVNSSIANFQLKIYQSPDDYNYQSDVEFCYGSSGGNPLSPSNNVVTTGAAIGLKGEFFGDYLNGLDSTATTKTSQKTTNFWPPTGATDTRIRFDATRNQNIDEFWGDGDADFSKAPGGRHYDNVYKVAFPQNRYVTFNDIRMIMKSVVTKVPLDSVRRRQAYHADVNHNGRYFFDNSGKRVNITPQSKVISDNLPAGVTNIKKVFFQATEDDAKTIIQYLSARVPQLPWIYDTIPQYGKVSDIQPANSLIIGESTINNDGSVLVPVYINGSIEGGLSTSFAVNGNVLDVIKNTNFGEDQFVDFYNNNIAFAGNAKYTNNEPVFYVKYSKENTSSAVQFKDVKFNDNEIGNMTTNTSADNSALEIVTKPNPFSETTTINFNIKDNGQFTLAIYDLMGNKVKDIINNNLTQGSITRTWDGTDNFGNKIESGMYVCRLNGANVNLSQRIVYTK